MVNSTTTTQIPNVRAYQSGIRLTFNQASRVQGWISSTNHFYNVYRNTQIGLLQTYHQQYPDIKQRQKLSAKQKHQYFLTSYSFQSTYNHYIKTSPYVNLSGLDGIPAHTLRYAFTKAERAFTNYFKGLGGFPRYKSGNSVRSIYFDNARIEANKIRIPKLGWLQLQRIGYLPTTNKLKKRGYHVTGVWLHEKANRWYVSVQTNEPGRRDYQPLDPALHLGIDLGIKDFAILSNGKTYCNITKSTWYRHLENHRRRARRSMDRKRLRKLPHQDRVVTKNYCKARLHYHRVCRRISCYMENWIQQKTSQIIALHPSSITIENLNIQGMKHNHKLAPALQKIPLYRFRQVLTWKAKKVGIEVRLADTWFASTKRCSQCGLRNKVQFHGKASDLQVRTFHCPNCGLVIDRDKNAAINLQQLNTYTIVTNQQMDFRDNVLTHVENGIAVTK